MALTRQRQAQQWSLRRSQKPRVLFPVRASHRRTTRGATNCSAPATPARRARSATTSWNRGHSVSTAPMAPVRPARDWDCGNSSIPNCCFPNRPVRWTEARSPPTAMRSVCRNASPTRPRRFSPRIGSIDRLRWNAGRQGPSAAGSTGPMATSPRRSRRSWPRRPTTNAANGSNRFAAKSSARRATVRGCVPRRTGCEWAAARSASSRVFPSAKRGRRATSCVFRTTTNASPSRC